MQSPVPAEDGAPKLQWPGLSVKPREAAIPLGPYQLVGYCH